MATTTQQRRCIGSARFGIEPHEAPVEDFPAQPSQKDGLGRMCRAHWNQYTAGLARDAKVRKDAADGASIDEQPTHGTPAMDVEPEVRKPRRGKTAPAVSAPEDDSA